MQKLLEYLPFHFLLSLVAGICIQYVWTVWKLDIEWIFVSFLLFFGLLFLLKKKSIFILLSFGFFFALGIFVTHQTDDRYQKEYYENLLEEKSTAVLHIKEVLKPNAFSHRYEAEVVQIDSFQTLGSVLLSIRKDSLLEGLHVDDQLLIRSEFVEVKPPLNPHQFDYKNYLARQGIYQQVYLDSNKFLQLESKITFLGWIAKLRSKIQTSLKQEGFSQDEFGVINALLLGQRQEVSKELLNDYSKAGAIHILAISGLHVGIILLILSWIFKPLERIKEGKLIKLILIVLILWFFALLAGMSPSVVRAVTMFTAVAIGQSLQRKNSVIYSLVFSMFVLLLFKPMFLFDVGFQLSYLAVYGIVTIQPKLSNLWKPKWKLIDKVWQLTTVSLAAQLSVLPLSLFYFHQFPGLFLVSNLVIVPFLGIILMGGILIILLSVSAILPDFLVTIYGTIILRMNDFIRFVSHQEDFLFSGISFSLGMLITSYLVIIFGFRFFEQKKPVKLMLFLSSILIFQGVLLTEKYWSQTQNAFLVLHQNRKSISGIRAGTQLQLLDSVGVNRTLESYVVGEKLELRYEEHYQNYLKYQDQDILLVDSLGVYELNGLESPIVILQHSPRINLYRLIETLHPKQIVADGSNYKSLMSLWEETCKEMNVAFWNTSEDGMYVLNLNLVD
jgi:competence protein ComEC